MDTVIIWGFIIIMLACGFFSLYVAAQKGFDSILWFFLGLMFGPLALLAAIGLPDHSGVRELSPKLSREASDQALREMAQGRRREPDDPR